jgi:hypothetical protein
MSRADPLSERRRIGWQMGLHVDRFGQSEAASAVRTTWAISNESNGALK